MTTSNIAAHGSAPASLSVVKFLDVEVEVLSVLGFKEAIMQENLVLLPQYIITKWILR